MTASTTAAAGLSVDTADLLTAHTILGCLVREVAGPERRTGIVDRFLVVYLPHTGHTLRARLRRASTVAAHRFTGPVQSRQDEGGWRSCDADDLAALIDAELTLRTGHGNDEFAVQVAASRDALEDILRTRPKSADRPVPGFAGAYLDSEQSLVAGHPRHPTPKSRSGGSEQWRRYAPEARSAFPLRWLAAPAELVRDHAIDDLGFDGHARTADLSVPEGFRALAVHPWQFALMSADATAGPVLRAAMAAGALRDLGETGPRFHPTASVRTLYQPEADLFLKTSLNVRITNCLRKNADYELAGAVELTRILAEPCARVTREHQGFGFLPEPAARTVALPAAYGDERGRHALLEGFGTIVRGGLGEHLGGQVHLAGALAAEHRDPAGTRTRLADLVGTANGEAWALRWWRRYTTLLVPPVLSLWAEHGVVLEPHPQNVLVVLGPDNLPVRVLARDLEGTKLLADRHADTLAALPSDVARAVAYDDERAWNRIAYCLFVNHLTEFAGALADLVHESAPGMCRFEDQLWSDLGDTVAAVSRTLGHPPRLRALLSGVPLPAKTNLLVRWERQADRQAGYVPFPNPIGRLL
ncbi:IucA/IucC family protein [Actinokineospora sp.]|uniref:IucA/IucC family protein n=1 Tax=Actinokineospora sp. TaxID=1872133 RepID=UPI003D6AD533